MPKSPKKIENKNTAKKSRSLKKVRKKTDKEVSSKLCPIGEHWVRKHPLKVPASKKSPAGVTTRRAHCARNPASKGQITPKEIKNTSKDPSFQSDKKPCPITLRFKSGDAYDDLIAGWVKYWNDVFKLDEPLAPNLVKALIASESGFDRKKLANRKNPKSARGLMQLLDKTRVILGDENGELKGHRMVLTRTDLLDANLNICAGVRWLFYKRLRASAKLGRTASWEEAVAEYKSLSKYLKAGDPRAEELFDRFKKYLSQLELCKKT